DMCTEPARPQELAHRSGGQRQRRSLPVLVGEEGGGDRLGIDLGAADGHRSRDPSPGTLWIDLAGVDQDAGEIIGPVPRHRHSFEVVGGRVGDPLGPDPNHTALVKARRSARLCGYAHMSISSAAGGQVEMWSATTSIRLDPPRSLQRWWGEPDAVALVLTYRDPS